MRGPEPPWRGSRSERLAEQLDGLLAATGEALNFGCTLALVMLAGAIASLGAFALMLLVVFRR